MIDSRALFQEKIGRLLRWEKVKRREQILIRAFFYSVLASLVILPVGGLFPPWAQTLPITPVLFLVMTLLLLFWRPWGGKDSIRTVFLLDKSLRLQERALTAWEIVRRGARKPAEMLVLEEAAANLKTVEVEGLFKRRLTWHAMMAPPLFLIWLWMVWFGVDFQFSLFNLDHRAKVQKVARELKEFSQGLRHRAEENQLSESLKTAHTLEEVAERGLKGELEESGLRDDLNEAVRGIRDLNLQASEGAGLSMPGISKETLADLKAEIKMIQNSLNTTDLLLDKGILGSNMLERLNRFAPLRRELGKESPSGKNLNKKEAREFLENLQAKMRAELDRRSLMETQAFLMQMLDGMEGEKTRPMESRNSPLGSSSFARDDKNRGRLPGDRPGTRGPKVQFPGFKAQAATHLRGLLREGMSAGFTVRGELPGKESEVSQEEIVTRYQRQIEGELASEQIPRDLKETVKSYFLSLGMTQVKRSKRGNRVNRGGGEAG